MQTPFTQANIRGKGIILLHAADSFTFALLGLGLVVEVELIQTVGKRQQDLRREAR